MQVTFTGVSDGVLCANCNEFWNDTFVCDFVPGLGYCSWQYTGDSACYAGDPTVEIQFFDGKIYVYANEIGIGYCQFYDNYDAGDPCAVTALSVTLQISDPSNSYCNFNSATCEVTAL